MLNCINSSNKQYEIVLISDLNRVKFEIKTDELILLPIGFCDDRFFFNEGFYDIGRDEFIQYEIDLKYKRIINSETLIPKEIHRLCLWCDSAFYTDSN